MNKFEKITDDTLQRLINSTQTIDNMREVCACYKGKELQVYRNAIKYGIKKYKELKAKELQLNIKDLPKGI